MPNLDAVRRDETGCLAYILGEVMVREEGSL